MLRMVAVIQVKLDLSGTILAYRTFDKQAVDMTIAMVAMTRHYYRDITRSIQFQIFLVLQSYEDYLAHRRRASIPPLRSCQYVCIWCY